MRRPTLKPRAALGRRVRVFLSAVTSECRKARKQVASDLRSIGLEVKVQEDFRQEPGEDATTLKKLHDYVATCDRVVAIMGQRSGSFPPPDAAAPFKAMLPDGFDRASLTQWEVHFARHYRKRMSIYVASDKFVPANAHVPNADEDPALQGRLREYLFERKGLDRSTFDSPADLSRQVLKEQWHRGSVLTQWGKGPILIVGSAVAMLCFAITVYFWPMSSVTTSQPVVAGPPLFHNSKTGTIDGVGMFNNNIITPYHIIDNDGKIGTFYMSDNNITVEPNTSPAAPADVAEPPLFGPGFAATDGTIVTHRKLFETKEGQVLGGVLLRNNNIIMLPPGPKVN